jgi:hypothetical protein
MRRFDSLDPVARMGDIYKADQPLLQPDADENQTSLGPVELTAYLVQGIWRSDRRKP